MRKPYYKYPLRECHTQHNCAVCGKNIVFGQQYFDGGSNMRCHVTCIPIKPGTKVRYYPFTYDDEHDGKIYTVRSVGKAASGHYGAWLEGRCGYITLDALSEVSE